ncbi:transcriptional regulator TACO1-like protein [Hysterangium stoloniferum]|nr:transcriptional regulator TACO1-like protein [Hysterangium stoloniferum]
MLLFRRAPSSQLCARCLTSSAVSLSGHNKWSKIKEGKGANDKLKSKIYSRANREIFFAVKSGDSADPELNSALSQAISRAKSNGVPKANIQAALEQAKKTKGNGADLYVYEALFDGKIGMFIECFSDNNARTVRDLKSIFKKHSTQLTAVAYMFKEKMVIHVDLRPQENYDDLFNHAVDNGAHDLSNPYESAHSGCERRLVEVTTSREDGGTLIKQLRTVGYEISHSEIVKVPLEEGAVLDDETRNTAQAFLEELEDYPDVHRITLSTKL